MADDEDAIYVDVIPRLDEAAADEAAEKLSDKFKNAAKDLGASVKDHLKDAGESIKDVLRSDTARDIGREVGRAVAEEIGTHVEDAAGGIGRDLGASVRDAIGGDTIDGIASKINTLKDTMAAFRSHDFGGGIGGLNALLGGDIPVLDQAQSLLDKFDKTKATIQETATSAKEIAELFGGSALVSKFAAPETAAKALGPWAAMLAGVSLTDPGHFGTDLDKFLGGVKGFDIPTILKSGGSLAWDSLKDNPFNLFGAVPYPWESPKQPPQSPKPTGKTFVDPEGNLLLGGGGAAAGHSWDTDKWFFPNDPEPPPSRLREIPNFGGGGASSGSANVQTQSATVSAAAATITAGSLSLGGLSLPSIQAPRGASGMHTDPGWTGHFASGGILPGSSPGFDNMLGNVGGTPIGLEGGEYVVNPQATKANMGLLEAINSGALYGFDEGTRGGSILDNLMGGGGKQAGPVKGQSPGGVKGQQPGGIRDSQPGAPMPNIHSPQGAPDQPDPAQTIIPQGEGKGFGLSGGIIGAAEGAASTGADLFAPGSGAAVQIGMQEANRAIEYGVKAGITLGVEAPLDTFWLSDSGLSDPSHSWFGKLGLNMIGQTGGLAKNLAGLTQAPLTPGQGGQGSPMGGQQQGQGGSAPTVHIEHQYNNSDNDHMGNNQTIAARVAANTATSNSSYGY